MCSRICLFNGRGLTVLTSSILSLSSPAPIEASTSSALALDMVLFEFCDTRTRQLGRGKGFRGCVGCYLSVERLWANCRTRQMFAMWELVQSKADTSGKPFVRKSVRHRVRKMSQSKHEVSALAAGEEILQVSLPESATRPGTYARTDTRPNWPVAEK